jgi:hypothetical protein
MKIIKEGLLPRDDPIFSGRVETFSVRKSAADGGKKQSRDTKTPKKPKGKS